EWMASASIADDAVITKAMPFVMAIPRLASSAATIAFLLSPPADTAFVLRWWCEPRPWSPAATLSGGPRRQRVRGRFEEPVADGRADGQRGGGGGRRRVDHVDRAGRRREGEVVEQRAVGRDGLGADAGRRGHEVDRLDGRHEALHRGREALVVERAGHL